MGMMRRSVLCVLAMLVVFLVAPSAGAQERFPTRAITLIVPWTPGHATSIFCQVLAEYASKYLGQKVTIVNKPGGGGGIGTAAVATAEPDGYTIGEASVGQLAILEMQQDLPYRWADLRVLMTVVAYPPVLAVKSGSYKSVEEYLAAAGKAPMAVKYGHVGRGGHFNLLHAYLNKKAGVKMTDVPFPGAEKMALAVVGGVIQGGVLMFEAVKGFVEAGQVTVLASMGDRRLPAYPSAPSIKELGFDLGIGDVRWILHAPKKVPETRFKVLHDAFRQALDDPEFRARAEKMGALLRYESPEGALRAVEQERRIIYGILKDINLLKAGYKADWD